MFDDRYLDQVRLLIRCMPEVAKQTCFALKGGTAINLFVRDMPRISVDIDLAYLPIKPRDESLAEISKAVRAIAADIRSRIDGAIVDESRSEGRVVKLLVALTGSVIKIEPNLVFRGSVYPAEGRELVPSAQSQFEAYVSVPAVIEAELYGSKLCAALDRQHPRDLFDIKQMMDTVGLTDEIRSAFIVYLAGHPRPMKELLDPRMQDIEAIYQNQFAGMTTDPVSLDDLVAVQHGLAGQVLRALTENEKAFLLSVKRGEPEWDRMGIAHLQDLPALRWKVMNIQRMDARKRTAALAKLEKVLGAS